MGVQGLEHHLWLGAMTPPWNAPSPSTKSTVMAVPASITMQACLPWLNAPMALISRSCPTVESSSSEVLIGIGRSEPRRYSSTETSSSSKCRGGQRRVC